MKSAAKALGWTDATNAIGQQIKFQGNPGIFRIGGVVKDFHFGPLQETYPAIVFYTCSKRAVVSGICLSK
jgi:putative ABC transport system permease protein